MTDLPLTVFREFLIWFPNLALAMIVLVIGGLAARAFRNRVRSAAENAGLSNAHLLARAASATG